MFAFHPGETHFFPLVVVGLGDPAGKLAHFAKKCLPFCETNCSASVQHVECMGTFNDIVVSRQHQAPCQRVFRLLGEQRKHLPQVGHIGNFIVVSGMFAFRHLVHIAIGAAFVPADKLEIAYFLQAHGNALKPISDLDRGHVQNDPARLLEVGELSDFLTVQPDFPSETPGRERRRFPVIFHKADIMLRRINTQGKQRIEIEFLRVARIGLEDDLELSMLLKAVWVDPVAPVVRSDRRFHVRDTPGLRTEHPQKSGGVHRAGADLGVVRLPNQATLPRPVGLEFENDRLKV